MSRDHTALDYRAIPGRPDEFERDGGSIVGTRKDMREAMTFAADGQIEATIETQPLDAINAVFARLKRGDVNGRIVLDLT